MLSKQISAVLRAAKLTVYDHTASFMPLGGIDIGVHVAGNDDLLCNDIVRLLNERHIIAVRDEMTPSPGTDNASSVGAVIMVGAKPPSSISIN